jgi:hypothetical protein
MSKQPLSRTPRPAPYNPQYHDAGRRKCVGREETTELCSGSEGGQRREATEVVRARPFGYQLLCREDSDSGSRSSSVVMEAAMSSSAAGNHPGKGMGSG